MARRLATVFGGSGFIGRHLVRRLTAGGWTVRVAVRDPEGAAFLKPMGEIDQVVPILADVTRESTVRAAVEGAEAVVNLVGILYERGRRSFEAIHVTGAGNVAAAAKAAGARRLVHISALGAAKDSPSAYGRSKAEGEEAVRAAFPEATILRPSIVFGPEDDFFNRFAKMATILPFLPVFTGDGLRPRRIEGGIGFDVYGSGGPKFQPVYVGDVADAIMAGLESGAHAGRTFELGGPRVYSMKEIMELILRQIDRRRLLLPVPFPLGAVQAAFLQYMPKPMLTPDQVRQLRSDNVVSGREPGLAEIGITPTAAEVILPTYLSRFRPVGSVTTRQPPHP